MVGKVPDLRHVYIAQGNPVVQEGAYQGLLCYLYVLLLGMQPGHSDASAGHVLLGRTH